jgi:hypothetical protein
MMPSSPGRSSSNNPGNNNLDPNNNPGNNSDDNQMFSMDNTRKRKRNNSNDNTRKRGRNDFNDNQNPSIENKIERKRSNSQDDYKYLYKLWQVEPNNNEYNEKCGITFADCLDRSEYLESRLLFNIQALNESYDYIQEELKNINKDRFVNERIKIINVKCGQYTEVKPQDIYLLYDRCRFIVKNGNIITEEQLKRIANSYAEGKMRERVLIDLGQEARYIVDSMSKPIPLVDKILAMRNIPLIQIRRQQSHIILEKWENI